MAQNDASPAVAAAPAQPAGPQYTYHHVVANIPPATASEVRDILLAPPAEDAYRVLKETLIRRLTPSEPERLQQLLRENELCDRRPSQLLRHMQQLAGCTAGLDSRLVQELFLQRLPATVRIGVTASGETDVSKIAEMADRLMAVATPMATPAVATVLAEASPSPALLEIRAEISRLADRRGAAVKRKPKHTAECYTTTAAAVLVPP
ncbi:uncharacterized protein LOC119375087 [Rhipicephalus sanguineus]|uniref:uncharacterized protein LOC119375087 n=1 Tax=Rhipicephalus sanguineus TaxID=34632 RepID=UPI001893A7F7|nr:uncharacterized protein LOC119375087 [Rhipicephalus sanguineus]